MKLNQLKPPQNHKTRRKRVGRGIGSGMGGTSTRGHKGQMSRTGSRKKPGFEGGQMPLIRRIPKRGFNNFDFRKTYQVVNLDALKVVKKGTVIDPVVLKEIHLIRNSNHPVKILGEGNLATAFTVKAHAFSKSAVTKIEAAGGKIEVIKG